MFSKLYECCFPKDNKSSIIIKDFTINDMSGNAVNNIDRPKVHFQQNQKISDSDYAKYIKEEKKKIEENGQNNKNKSFPALGVVAKDEENNNEGTINYQGRYEFYNKNNLKTLFLDRLKLLNEAKQDQNEFQRKMTHLNKPKKDDEEEQVSF